jgi:hypothetical protein
VSDKQSTAKQRGGVPHTNASSVGLISLLSIANASQRIGQSINRYSSTECGMEQYSNKSDILVDERWGYQRRSRGRCRNLRLLVKLPRSTHANNKCHNHNNHNNHNNNTLVLAMSSFVCQSTTILLHDDSCIRYATWRQRIQLEKLEWSTTNQVIRFVIYIVWV